MKQLFRLLTLSAIVSLVIVSCKKDAKTSTDGVSDEIRAKLNEQGFNGSSAIKYEGAYLVEGDLLMTEEQINEGVTSPILRIAENEQYRTRNLVKNFPRVITIAVSNLPAVYADATDECISRYNAENLQLTFQRVSSGADITIIGFYQAPSGGFITLGSSGFPTKQGNPYSQVKMNTHPQAYGDNPNLQYVASVLQHEIGHCIGMRHTDYMNRAYSCGSGGNEGAGSVGAILIPGTPSGPDAASWMLACSNGGNRTFNTNDKVALNYLY
ncbi:MAG: M57 family metalloprotease [Chitinophagaceae bacterium]